MIRTSRDGLDLLILRQGKSDSFSRPAQVGCPEIRQSSLSPNGEHVYALDQFHAAGAVILAIRKAKIRFADHAHRIRPDHKLISSRRAARTPEHLSHVKVMIILDACDSACDQGCDQLRPGGWPVPMRVVSGGSYRPQLTS